jgi:hypothetical protein
MIETEYFCRVLPSGVHACVIPLTFGRARIVLNHVEHLSYYDGW